MQKLLVLLFLLSACSADAKLSGSAGAPALTGNAAAAAAGRQYAFTDAHLHLVDFLQGGDGIRAVVAAMDRVGVTDAMITGMPLVKKWDPADPRKPLYYLEDDARTYWYSATDALVARELSRLPEESRKRFHPFITGFNGTDMNALDHVERMIAWYPGLWQGIGEVMARHDDLTALTYGESSRANGAPLARIYDFAAQHDLPVSVHSNIGSVWLHEPVYLHEMEDAVKQHPRTRFIWCHAGISRRIVIPSLVDELTRMLKKYPNLWIDISWVVFDDDIAPGGKVNPAWLKMINAFPTRFMIGTDKVGVFSNYDQEILKYKLLLDELPPATAQKVAHDNFLAVLPARGNK